jgi:hypothetical protein
MPLPIPLDLRVTSCLGKFAQCRSLFPCFSQRQISTQHERDIRITGVADAKRFATQAVNVCSPKTDVSALAVDLHAKHPRLRPTGRYQQEQPVTILIGALHYLPGSAYSRFGVADLCNSQLAQVLFPTFIPT